MKYKKPSLFFRKDFPSQKSLNADRSIVIFDQILKRDKKFKQWLQKFPFVYPVHSGENLKDIRGLATHLESILQISTQIERRPLQIVAVGGGSVGDFAGFVASVLKRGVGLVHVPSTWLSAIDSAHGGKTALNVSGFKNQVGTFYQAEKIYLVQNLLLLQPEVRLEEAFGEALKISLIEGGSLWKKMKSADWKASQCWKLLPQMIEAKYKIVEKDPFESKGLRHLLNLGHTVGHVLESELKIPHGKAVLLGLRFSIDWSVRRGLMKRKIQEVDAHPVAESLRRVKDFSQALRADKKRAPSGKIHFVFLAGPGKVFTEEVRLKQLLQEIDRQKKN